MSSLTSGQSTEATSRVSRIEAKQARSMARKATKATKAAREAAAARAEEQAIAKFGLPPSPRRSPRRRAQVQAAQLAELLQSDIPSERQSVYDVLLSYTPDDAEYAVAFVAPLATVSVQSVDVVNAEEYRRSALALAHLISLDCGAIGAEWLKDEKCLATYRARGNALDVALSKGPDEMTHDDAMTAAAGQCCFAAAVVGEDFEPLFAASEVAAADWMGSMVATNPYRQAVAPDDTRNIRLSTLLLELLHDDAVDAVKLPEGLAVGVWNLLSNLASARPAVGLHQVETGILSLAVSELRRAPSGDWSGPTGYLFLAVFWALGMIKGPGAQLFTTTSGLLEMLLVVLKGYETIRAPEKTMRFAVYYAVSCLSVGQFVTSSYSATDALRGAASSIRAVLDRPIVVSEELGLSSSFSASGLAADIFGADEFDSPFVFLPRDIDTLVTTLLRILNGSFLNGTYLIPPELCDGLLNLTISDAHKRLLLKNRKTIPLLVLGLFLDHQSQPHPRGTNAMPPATATPEHIQATVQCRCTEALQQLALNDAGRQALLLDPAVIESLEEVARRGLSVEARGRAQRALLSLGGTELLTNTSADQRDLVAGQVVNYLEWSTGRTLTVTIVHIDQGNGATGEAPFYTVKLPDNVERQTERSRLTPLEASPHVMLSYQWDTQPMMVRINKSLKRRGYLTWMDLDQLDELSDTEVSGSVLDGLSVAIGGAAVVCIGVSRGYKESANCRLEAQYCTQQEKPLLSLMMEENYLPSGWLGLLLGTDSRLHHTFHGPELADESIFEARVSALVSELGSRGKAQRVLAPGYGLAPVDAMMPTRRRAPATSLVTEVVPPPALAPAPAPAPAAPTASATSDAQQVRMPATLPAHISPAASSTGEDDFLSRLPPAAAAAVRKARGLPEPVAVVAPPALAPVQPVPATPEPHPQPEPEPEPEPELTPILNPTRTPSVLQPLSAASGVASTTIPEPAQSLGRARSFLDPNMAAGFSRTVRDPEALQQHGQLPHEQPAQEQPAEELRHETTPIKWSTSLADLATACGAESPDALLDLTDDQLEQLIDETSAQNSSFKVNTLHQINITKEAREKRAAAHQDPLLKFLTDLGVQRIYDGLIHGLGALYLEDLKDIEDADLDELGLRKLEKRRLCRAISELDELDEKLLRTPVAAFKESPPPQSSVDATAAATATVQADPTTADAETSRALGTRERTRNRMQYGQPQAPESEQIQEREQQLDAAVLELVRASADCEADIRGGPASPITPRNRPRSCPGTPSSWRDDYSHS